MVSLSELQAPGKARSLVSMATCLPGWSLQPQPPLGRLKRGLRVARASPVPTSAPARFRPEAGCSFWAGALPEMVPMGTAVGTRCPRSDPQIQPALQFRQRLSGSEPLEERLSFWCPSPSPPKPPKKVDLRTWGRGAFCIMYGTCPLCQGLGTPK